MLVYLGIYHQFYCNSSTCVHLSRCMLLANVAAQLVSVVYMTAFVLVDTEKLFAISYGAKSYGLIVIYTYLYIRRESIANLLRNCSRKRYTTATVSLLVFTILSTLITVVTSFRAIELASPILRERYGYLPLIIVETIYNLSMWPELCFVPAIFVMIINDLSSRIQDFSEAADELSSRKGQERDPDGSEKHLGQLSDGAGSLVRQFLALKEQSTKICENLHESIFVLVGIVFGSGCGEIVHIAAYLEHRREMHPRTELWCSANYMVYSNMSVIVSIFLFCVLVYTGHRLDRNGRRARIRLRQLALTLPSDESLKVTAVMHGDDLSFRFAGFLRLNSQFGMRLVSTIATYAVIFFQVKHQVIMGTQHEVHTVDVEENGVTDTVVRYHPD